MKRKRIDKALLFILPSLVGFIIFYIWPFIISLGYAFVDSPIKGQFIGLDNFRNLFYNKSYLMGLKNTLIFMGISIPLITALALAVALFIKKINKYKAILTFILLIPLVIPSGSMVFFWKKFFEYNGYLNNLLGAVNINKINWLESSIVQYVIILIFIWKNIGYNIILFIAGVSNIPKEYYEAASVEGANGIQRLFRITLPNLLPTFFLVTIMSIINSFKVFKEVYLITGSYPHESIYLLQHFMNNMFKSLNYPKLTTATCILVLIITLVTQFLFRLEKKVLT